MLPDPADCAAAYGALRRRITAVVEDLDEGDLQRPVPACPAWSVADLVGHLVGAARDVSRLDLEGVASDAWTDAQVQRARGRPVAELLAEWAVDGPATEDLLRGAPAGPASQLVFDTCTHEQDLYGALGRVGDRDHEQLPIALAFVVDALDGIVRGAGLAATELVTPQDRWLLGEGPIGVRLEGSRFDLLRALGGRRTRDELDALVTAGSFEPFEVLFAESSPIHLPAAPLGE